MAGTAAGPAFAGDKDRCAAAYEDAQRAQRRGALLSARGSLLVCLQECSDVARPECARWLDEIELALPSIVVTVKRSDGTDVQGAVVRLEEREIVADGRAIQVDPGPHELVVVAEGQRINHPLVIREGERGRSVVVELKGPAAPPAVPRPLPPLMPLPPTKKVPIASWALGGIGAAGLATFGAVALIGNGRYADLEDCRPFCSRSEVSSVKDTYMAADIALSVGVVSLAAAVVVYLFAPAPAAATSAQGF